MKRSSRSIKLDIWEDYLKKSIPECKLEKEPTKGRTNYSHSVTVCEEGRTEGRKDGNKYLEKKRVLEI